LSTLEGRFGFADNLVSPAPIARRMMQGDESLYMSKTAYRKSVGGVIGVPEIVPFWNIEKVA
jgi:hypothetical protein